MASPAKGISIKSIPGDSNRIISFRVIEAKPDNDCLRHITPQNNTMQFKTVDDKYILNASNRIERGKASGPDKVTVTVVKYATRPITGPLMMTYNSSLKNVVFPDIWKIARVTPIVKAGLKTNVSNYRSISVISVFSRTLGRLSHDQLFEIL